MSNVGVVNVDITLFNINIDNKAIEALVDKLSRLRITVPKDVAEKQQRLEMAGRASPEMRDIEENVRLLTNYLIQKSFVSTIRSVVKAVQLADRLKVLQRDENRSQLIDIVDDFLRNLYSIRLVSPDGVVISDSGNAVLTLFQDIIEGLLDVKHETDEETFREFLTKKQQEYVTMVLDRARRLTNTIETITSNPPANEKLEALLNRMETAQLEWLIETYSLATSQATGKLRLPELDNNTQKEISNAVLVQMGSMVKEFQQATEEGSVRKGVSKVKRFFGHPGIVDLSQTNLLEAEQFIVELRLHVSYRQQITILSSLLDKVNEFSAFLDAFEAVLSAATQTELAEAGRREQTVRNRENEDRRASKDKVDIAIANLSEAAGRPREAETELHRLLSQQNDLVAERIVGLKSFFAQKSERANKVLAKLTEIGNMVRVMGPMVIGEARQPKAPFTTELIGVVSGAIEDIQKTEGWPSLPTSGRADVTH